MKRILAILLLTVSIGIIGFAASKPTIDGRAIVAEEGVLPKGLFAKTVGYLPGDSVSVTNPATGITINVLVLGSIDPSNGVAIMLSPEAAEKLFITPGVNTQVKVTKRTGSLDEVSSGLALLQGEDIPDDLKAEIEKQIAAMEEKNSTEPVDTIPVEETFEETRDEPAETVETVVSEKTGAVVPAEPKDVVPAEQNTIVPAETENTEPEEVTETEPAETAETVVSEKTGAAIPSETEVTEPEEVTETEPAETAETIVSEKTGAVVPAEQNTIVPAEQNTIVLTEDLEEDSPIEEVIVIQEDIGLYESKEIAKEPITPVKPTESEPEEEKVIPAENTKEPAPIEEIVTEDKTPAEKDLAEESVKSTDTSLVDPFAPIILVPAEERLPEEKDTIDNDTMVITPVPLSTEEEVTVEPVVPESTLVMREDWNIVPTLSQLERGKYYVQFITLAEEENILRIMAAYSQKYPIVLVPLTNGSAYQVMIGPLSVHEYGMILARFKELGYKDAFARKIN
ncbi:MAG: hypothetical protein SPE30_11185 [Candidatus Treponema excrementipullorum]|nr:hypothetical protein [Spirochaetia bacterium]MDD7011537.1 hypothetical protein [Candidatus Treponema excrementipullorum]MDY4466833.1 hypothetical protein [Candidatus Treponema excrementipullorum]